MKNNSIRPWILPAISALAVSGNASAVELGCGESLDAGKHCGIEVKCYSADITGSGEFGIDGGEFPVTYAYYNFSNFPGTLYCTGLIASTLPKQEYRCTVNGEGPDSSGDLAVQVEIDLTGCAD